MNSQQVREKHSQFFITMFIFTFLGAALLTAAGHFLIGNFASAGQENWNEKGQYLLVTSFTMAGISCYLLPWVRLPFAKDAVEFWFKKQPLEKRAANLIPNLILACLPFGLGAMVVYQAIQSGSTTYQSPLFAMGAFAFFGMSLMQSFLPLRIFFRKNYSEIGQSDSAATAS